MSRTEDLLRDALSATPTRQPNFDVTADLAQRARRARLQIAATATVAAITVTAAIVVPLALNSGGRMSGTTTIGSTPSPSPKKPVKSRATDPVWFRDSQSVATSATSVFVLGYGGNATGTRTSLDELNPTNGAITRSFTVPAPASTIQYGEGRVWVWGGGDGGSPTSELSVLNPDTGQVLSTSLTGSIPAGDQAMTFTDGQAWTVVGGTPYSFQIVGNSLRGTPVPASTGSVGINRHGVAYLERPQPDGTTLVTVGSDSINVKQSALVWLPSVLGVSADGTTMLVVEGHRVGIVGKNGATTTYISRVLGSHIGPVVGQVLDQLFVVEVNNVSSNGFTSSGELARIGTGEPHGGLITYNKLRSGEIYGLALDPKGGILWIDSNTDLHHWRD